MPAITNHAKTRIKSRTGIPTKAMKKMVRRAYERGIKVEDTDGELREYCQSKRIKKHGRRTDIRIHGGFVYIFDGMALLTAYQIPQEYRAEAEALQARLKRIRNADAVRENIKSGDGLTPLDTTESITDMNGLVEVTYLA